MIRRSAAVVLAVTLQRLHDGRLAGFSPDQELCLSALRRSSQALRTASDEDLAAYIGALTPGQLRGVVSNLKGIFHEMLIERAEDADGDAITAELFELTNRPGADLEFILDGTVIREVQAKAVQSPAAIIEHFARYPETDVFATSEVCVLLGDAFPGRVTDSGFSNADLTRMTEESLAALDAESLSEVMQDGAVTSALVTGALHARAVLSGRGADAAALRTALETTGIGVVTAVTVETLLAAI